MRDVAESVLARLLNIARANGLVYNELLMRYVLERIFYRIGTSSHSGKFILKGGNLFVCWQGGFDFRPTMDADMLYRGVGTPEQIKAVFTEICTAPAPDDGLRIDVASRHPAFLECSHRTKQNTGANRRRSGRRSHAGSENGRLSGIA